jgi:ribonuclease VapC
MVVDTSAVMAILRQEPDASAYAQSIETANVRLISAVSVLEAGILAVSRKGDEGARELDSLLLAAELEVVPFDGEQAAVARDAFRRFGKGRHAANLNFGDCAVYALVATRAESLLFKGDDFSVTDLQVSKPRG